MRELEGFIPCQRAAFWVWKIIGIWATEDESPYYRAYRRIYHFFFTGVYLFAMFCSSFFMDNLDTLWTEILFLLPTEIAMLVKSVTVANKFEAIYGLNRTTVSKEFKTMCPKQRKEYERYFGRFSKIMMFYYFCSVLTVLASLGFIFDGRLKLPFFNWFFWVPIDRDHINNYYILAVYQIVGMTAHCLLNVSGDVNIAYLLSTAGKQLDLLSYNLAQLPVYPTRSDIEKELYKKKFEEHIQQYNRIYDFARETEKQVSWSVFAQICASGVTICAVIFRLSATSALDNVSSTFYMYFYLISMLTQIFLPCYSGNDVTLKSQKLTNALYTSDWYRLALNDRKDLKMMMLRTNKPIRLKAGNFFNFNLDDFTSTLNRSYSLYAVINRQK
ncbi:odorant receptor 94a-like [Armigeres subalbatus]|uniref:odorant receptor 94a-like n=1 Tax=Armigeres subalbatus TaxID=124917 RepID=UPI002ED5B6E6